MLHRAALILLTAAYSAAHAGQPPHFLGPMTLKLDQLAADTANTVCTISGRQLPNHYNLAIHDNSDEMGLDLVIELQRGSPQVGVLLTNGFGQAQVLQNTATRIHAVGMSFDLQTVLNGLVHRSSQDELDRLTITLCRAGDGYIYEGNCASFRSYITVQQGTSIDTALCRAAPILLPADDLGDLPNDNVTPVLRPRMTVVTTSPTVAWYRDDMLIGSSNPVSGVASFTYPPVASYGVHSYEVVHGTASARSAPRFLHHHERLFRHDFELKGYIP